MSEENSGKENMDIPLNQEIKRVESYNGLIEKNQDEVRSNTSSAKLEESVGTYPGEPKTARLESQSFDTSTALDRIIFYNARTMVTDFETNLVMVLWTEHLCLEVICGIIGVVEQTIHLYADYKLLINCLPKAFQGKDLQTRAIERRRSIVEFILQHLAIQENEGTWELSLASSELLVKKDRRRSLSSEAVNANNERSIAVTQHSDMNSASINLNSTSITGNHSHHHHQSHAVELTKLIQVKPTNLREYTYQEFNQVFCTIPMNSSEYDQIAIPSLRDIMRRQSLAVNSSDLYDHLANRSIRRHTFDVSVENPKGSVKATSGVLLEKVWLNQPPEHNQSTTENQQPPQQSMKARPNLPSVKVPLHVPSSSTKVDSGNIPLIQAQTSPNFLPKIDPTFSQKNPTAADKLPNIGNNNISPDIENSLKALTSPGEEARKKHIYDYLITSGDNSMSNAEFEATLQQQQQNNTTANTAIPSVKNTTSANTDGNNVMMSKSHVALPRLLSPNSQTLTQSNQQKQQHQYTNSLDRGTLGLNNINDNSTGNISFASAPIPGSTASGPRRKSLGNPLPYDRSPLIPDESIEGGKQGHLPAVTRPSNSILNQPRRSFDQVSTGISSAIHTLAKGILPSRQQVNH